MSDSKPGRTVAIIGAGPAGMSAAVYAKISALDVMLFENTTPGGQILRTQRIDNYLGFPEGTASYELIAKFQEHLASFDIEPLTEGIDKIESGNGILKLHTTDDNTYECKAVIVATGARARLLGVPGEWRLYGKGVSTCAICDGNFFRGQTVAVVGGGTTAVEDVVHLAHLAKKVYHIHRRDELRLAGETSAQLAKLDNVERVFSHTVEEVLGEEQVEGVRVKSKKDDSVKELKIDGLFVAVGIAPNTEFLGDFLETDDQGFIIAKADMSTSVRGVFAAGDVRTTNLRQVCTAVADGAIAGISAAKYITGISLW